MNADVGLRPALPTTKRRDKCRMLREILESLRDVSSYAGARVGSVAGVKTLLRAAKCPIPRPRRTPAGLAKWAIETAYRGEPVDIGIDEP